MIVTTIAVIFVALLLLLHHCFVFLTLIRYHNVFNVTTVIFVSLSFLLFYYCYFFVDAANVIIITYPFLLLSLLLHGCCCDHYYRCESGCCYCSYFIGLIKLMLLILHHCLVLFYGFLISLSLSSH